MKRREASWQEGFLLSQQKTRRKSFGGGKDDEGVDWGYEWRVILVKMGFWVLVGILVARLAYLQVLEGGTQMLLATTNRVVKQKVLAPRGVVYDRKGKVLVRNVPIGEKGVTRQYVLGESAAHLVGYVSEVKEDELGCREGLCYNLGDLIGRLGVEKVFEATLRGRDGGVLVEVDSRGEVVREIGKNEAEAGSDITLSLDADMQRAMFDVMKNRKGAGVVVDMNGKVMAMVSTPSFEPNLFTSNPDEKKLKQLLSDTDEQYFFNRAIGGSYPPGSVYKLVTATAGLQEGVVGADEKIEDTGEIRINEYRYGNWYFDKYGRTEGAIDIEKALARSNDIYFYQVGERLGVDRLVSWSKKLGLGEKSGVELTGEVEGLIPTPLWKERYKGEKWFLGNTYHMAIGQGDVLVTPLQVARMTLTAVSGRLCKTSILRDSDASCSNLGVSTENLHEVREGMRQACASGGTAFPFFDYEPYVVCKTGTAQHGGEETMPHAWFTMAYPGENPEFVMTVMLDSAGEGSEEAAPVAKEILERWRSGN